MLRRVQGTDGVLVSAGVPDSYGFASMYGTDRAGRVQGIDGVLVSAGVPYSYGFAIIALTLLVKVATFPLSQKQVCLAPDLSDPYNERISQNTNSHFI